MHSFAGADLHKRVTQLAVLGDRQLDRPGFCQRLRFESSTSAFDGCRLKTKLIADPNEASRIPTGRQEPSARTFF